MNAQFGKQAGHDWIQENGSDVEEVAELVYGKVGRNPLRWVLAVPNDSDITCAKDLEGKRISTEAIGMTKAYLAKHGVNAKVEFSWGATEVYHIKSFLFDVSVI